MQRGTVPPGDKPGQMQSHPLTSHTHIMKTVLEFGVKGGSHIDNLIFPTEKLAARTAAAIVNMIENDPCASHEPAWYGGKGFARSSWESETHFVAMTRLDGRLRGSASAALWRKGKTLVMLHTVIHTP